LTDLKTKNELYMRTNEDLFLQTIEKNRAIIYKVALLYTRSVEDRKDLMQEIILQLWKSFEKFENRSSISTWLYRVAMNTAFHHLKKDKRLQKIDSIEEIITIQDVVNNNQEELVSEMLMAIQQLNAMDKGIVILYLEDKNHKEIAKIMGITISNVGTRMQRAKLKLKEIIKTN